jgi:hypothetical protein
MVTARFLSRWLRLPGRAALMLGLGALSTAGARADTPDQELSRTFGELLIRCENGKIFVSEAGHETELRLSATPERARLLRLLEEHGGAGVKLDADPRLIMSSGGGSGFYWWNTKKPVTNKPAPMLQHPPQPTAPPRWPEPPATPGEPQPAANGKG